MNADEIVQILDDVYFRQFHERETITNLHLLLRDGDRFLDVGGSLGQYPYFVNQRFRGLRITCIEADAIRYGELRKRCAEWTREGNNVISAVHAAACAKDGTVAFHSTESNVSGSIVDSDFAARFQELAAMGGRGEVDPDNRSVPRKVVTVPVRAVTLDSVCGDAIPQLVKIDVEGAEYEVVRGASGLLERGVTQFLVEVDKRGENAAMFEMFQHYGYRWIRFFNHTLFFHATHGRRVPRHMILLRRVWYKATRQFRTRGRALVGYK